MENHRLESKVKDVIDDLINEVNEKELTISELEIKIGELENKIEDLTEQLNNK